MATIDEAFKKTAQCLELLLDRVKNLETKTRDLEIELKELKAEYEKRFPSAKVIEELKEQIK